MKIVYDCKEETLFHHIDVGEVFFKDVAWMKIPEVRNLHGCTCNAIDLETGKPFCFDNLAAVERVEATLTLER